ncbi:MAG: methyltransferase domain-containing protein [Phenylobacterium sp.]|uniref:spermidine synthase n=1 Tax=Phenylobacterium sp. TaxID=1871053 RepID=UPI0027354606|nr:methyltransferase domain-containing protein [Phenylobacterium sp.]MDP3747152.1 methyltransferase domain-containing protein [Phenylobacterium sp.]
MKVLVQCDDLDRKVRIFEAVDDGSRFYFEDGALYTHVDAEGVNLLEYVSAMEAALKDRENLLLLGTAGGALATQLSRRGAKVTAVDNWPTAFEIARRWFHLPAEVECIHADALTFLRSTERRWDAVAIDVFSGTEIPDAMLTTDIGQLLAGVLSPGGLIVWNVADCTASWPAQWIARALRATGLTPRLVPVLAEDVGNTLVVCRAWPSR